MFKLPASKGKAGPKQVVPSAAEARRARAKKKCQAPPTTAPKIRLVLIRKLIPP